MDEFNEMGHWRCLTAKLNGEKFEPMDETAGTVRGWDPEKRIEL
jgi:hypothetical protein